MIRAGIYDRRRLIDERRDFEKNEEEGVKDEMKKMKVDGMERKMSGESPEKRKREKRQIKRSR